MNSVPHFFEDFLPWPEVVDEQPGPDEAVELVEDGAGQEHHEAPLGHKDHLALDVQGLVYLLLAGSKEKCLDIFLQKLLVTWFDILKIHSYQICLLEIRLCSPVIESLIFNKM